MPFLFTKRAFFLIFSNDKCIFVPSQRPVYSSPNKSNCYMRTGILTIICFLMLISLISAQQGVIFQKNSLIDNIPPVAVCDGSEQISLTSIPTKVFANTFDDGSNDETCFSHFLVKRMGEPDAAFKSYIEFTCNDVSSSPVKVVLRAVDCSDNFNDCWSNAYIEDKTKPTVVCPSDVTINCSDDISKYWGTPIANDNCGNVTLTSSIIDATNQCLSGYISKIWTGKDQFNNQSTCTQQIYLKHISDYSVTFPNDVTITQCVSPDDLKNTGAPVFSNKDCELVAVGFTDHDLPITDGNGCFVRIRKWQLINWCNFDPNKATHTKLGISQGGKKYKDDDGFFEYSQYIKVFETTDPKLTCKDTIVCISESNCLANFAINKPKVVDCSTNITYQLSGDLGASFNAIDVPVGIYTVKHNISDGCGNHSFCDVKITVQDCKKPTPVVVNGLSATLMVQNATVGVWASDFNQSSYDNCTNSSNLKFSFSTDVKDVFKIFNCDSIGLRTVKIWATDEAGNQDFALTTIDIQDNMNACDTSASKIFLSGSVTLYGGQKIQNANLLLGGVELETDSTGIFAFPLMNISMPNALQISKAGKASEDLSVLDIILISDHLLGKKALTNYVQKAAADVNHDKKITSGDMVKIRRIILGYEKDWGNWPAWNFAVKKDTFNNIFSYDFLGAKNSFLLDSTLNDTLYCNIIGYKTGNLKSSAINYDGKIGKRENTAILLADGKKLVYSGNEHLKGAQFALLFNAKPDNLEVFGGEYMLSESKKPGQFELKYLSNVELEPGETLLAWQGDFNQNQIQLSTSLEPLAIDENYSPKSIQFIPSLNQTKKIDNYQIFPNPIRNSINIDIELEASEQGIFQLTSADGKVYLYFEKELLTGVNKINIPIEIPNGNYILTLTTATKFYVNKLMKID